MDHHPQLAVRIFANVERKDDPRYPDRDAAFFVNRFRHHSTAHLWPGKRLPDLFYDPAASTPTLPSAPSSTPSASSSTSPRSS